ncbi:MAG: DUF2865 domain-containing protein [Pseudomonadota bacterium]
MSAAAVIVSSDMEARRSAAAAVTTAAVTETQVLQDDSWIANVRSGRYFRRRGSTSRAPKQSSIFGGSIFKTPKINTSRRSSLGRLNGRDLGASGSGRGLQASPRRYSTTFRTVCVRLCDGYYFPISTSTTRGRFRRDARKCESSCAAPTRLYYQPAAGDASEMVDLKGRKYTKLKTAFLYRTKYQSNCQCRAQPWEQQAKDRHKIYALRAERKKRWKDRKRRREIAGELKTLRKGIRTARKAQRTTAKAATKTAMAAETDDAQVARVEQFVTKQTARQNALTWDGARAERLERRAITQADEAEAAGPVAAAGNSGQRPKSSAAARKRTKAAAARRASKARARRAQARRQIRRKRARMNLGLRKTKRPTRRARPRVARARSNWRARAFSRD